jgi:metallophosphoesterase superfamily enzyme
VSFPNAARATGREIRGLCDSNRAEGVVFLGDVKDRLTNMTREGLESFGGFFRELDGINVMIAKGNHDAYIEALIKEVGFKATIAKEILLSDCALMHGNSMPSDEAVMRRYIVCGHGHVAAQINGTDRKAWLIAPVGEGMKEHYKRYNEEIRLVAAPAFNRLIIGSRIGYETREHLPLLSNRLFDFGRMKAYDLYGNALKSDPYRSGR